MTRRWLPTRNLAAPASPSEATANADQAWKVLSLVNDWLRHAETKLATTLTAAGVTGGALFNLVKDHKDGSFTYNACAVVCFAGVLGAAVFAALGLLPRLRLNTVRQRFCKSGNTEATTRNPVYFNDIAIAYPHGSPDYALALRNLTMTADDLVGHIAAQIQTNSTVAQRKYYWAARAMACLAIDLVGLAGLCTVIALKLW